MSSLLPATASAEIPKGVWLIDEKAALKFFGCGDLLCGRIIWLKTPRNAEGELKRDKLNPDPGQQQRLICGPTIIWDLRTASPGHWEDGWFYNPDDGATYSVSMELKSANLLVARIYVGVPLFGKTKTLSPVPLGTSEGWC